MKQKWYAYLWLAELLYWVLGLCNILFAWLGLLFFVIPLFVAIIGGSKAYCNRYCGRGQLFELLGRKWKLSCSRTPPKFLHSRWFRYGFLAFFLTMFCLMLFSTYQVFTGAPLKQTVTLLWTIKLPVAMGSGRHGRAVDGPVCLWLFRRYDDVHRTRADHHDFLPPKNLVRLLSHGNDDAGDLQTQAPEGGVLLWRNRQRKLRNF